MAVDQSTTGTRDACPWCGGTLAYGRTVPVGPPPYLGEANAVELHVECADDWEAFVSRARTVVANGARETLLRYPIENGTASLRGR